LIFGFKILATRGGVTNGTQVVVGASLFKLIGNHVVRFDEKDAVAASKP